MNLRKEIRQAYDKVQVPDEVAERLKQELYQKDFHEEEFSEAFQTEEITQRRGGKYMSFIAASVVLGISIGVSMWNMLDKKSENVFQPAATIPVERSAEPTEETTTAVSESVIEKYVEYDAGEDAYLQYEWEE